MRQSDDCFLIIVVWTAIIQALLWRDKRNTAAEELESSLSASSTSGTQGSDVDEKRFARTEEEALDILK
jgi:hypothetical protein